LFKAREVSPADGAEGFGAHPAYSKGSAYSLKLEG